MTYGHLFLAALAGGVGAWFYMRPKHVTFTALPPAPAQAAARKMAISSVPTAVPTLDQSPSASTGLYLHHLANAAQNMQTIQNGADTHEESIAVNQAYQDLGEPIDTLTVQKDLNVLGAKPALAEDGVMGSKTKDAIDSFQRASGLEPTGVMDTDTARALRQAVVTATMHLVGATS